MNPERRRFLADLRADLDGLIAGSVGSLTSYDAWERRCSLADLLRLSEGGDCPYDRPSIGPAYLGWYHAKRSHGALRALAPVLDSLDEGPIHVVDLGCGTGAGAWALLLLEASRIAAGGTPRPITYTGVDTSWFMLDTANALSRRLEALLAGRVAGFEADIELRLQSWSSAEIEPQGTVVALAAFLFDWSDVSRAADLAVTLGSALDVVRAETLVMSSAAGKRAVLATIAGRLIESGRWTDPLPGTPGAAAGVWSGPLTSTAHARRKAYEGVISDTLLRRPPRWEDDTGFFVTLRRGHAPELFPMGTVAHDAHLLLDEAQARAAQPDHRPTCILGAAGSGKSRVLVERVARSLEEADGLRRPRTILVTTFNKLLIAQLRDWLRARLSVGSRSAPRVRGEDGDYHMELDGLAHTLHVRLLNWDKVPTRLWGVPPAGTLFTREWLEWRLARAGDDELTAILRAFPDPDERFLFLRAEFDRVLYGHVAYERETYLTVPRKGRRTPLRRRSPIREQIFDLLMGGGLRDFTHVRIDAHRLLRSGTGPGHTYDEVYVDEYQDLALADFDLLHALVRDPHEVVVTGDTAQALRLGPTAGLPVDSGGRRWRRRRLTGSYRMPINLCTAVRPLAERIRDRRQRTGPAEKAGEDRPVLLEDDELVLPESVKGAVLGVRPVLVAGTRSEVKAQLAEILETYEPILPRSPGDHPVTVADSDRWTRDIVREIAPEGFRVEARSMYSIKGLERPCIVWSTKEALPTNEAVDEWVYTIITRSTCLAVIALSQEAPAQVRSVVAALDPDWLLYWTETAKETFDRWRAEATA